MSAGLSRRGGCFGDAQVESLEPRIVLAAAHDLAVVGMTYTGTDVYTPYASEVTWAEDRTVSGQDWTADAAGPAGPTPTNLTDLINGPSGSVIPFFETPTFGHEHSGARFIPGEGYPAGWLSGWDATSADVAGVIERAAGAKIADLTGSNWSFQITHISAAGIFTRLGQVSFNSNGGFFFVAQGGSGDPIWVGEGFEYLGDPVNGRFDIGMKNGDTARMYLSADQSTILIADLDGRDGDTWMGVGMRQGFLLPDADIPGSYRVGVLFEGQQGLEGGVKSLFDNEPASAWRLDLDQNGTFKGYGLEDADRADLSDPFAAGTWTHEEGLVSLIDNDTGLETTILLNETGLAGFVTGFQQQTPTVLERALGLVTRISPDSTAGLDTVFPAGILDPDGVPLVFDLRESADTWSVVDFERYARHDLTFWMDKTLGATPADIEAFQASDGRLVAAVTTDDGLYAMERDDAGFWRSRNLSTTLTGAENIVSTITVFTDRDGVAYVAGLTADGEMVTYEFDPAADSGAGAWGYTNLSTEHLTPQGEATPVFVGPLMSYVTSWNGLNIAGLAADGSIQAVWTGNGGQVWHASNLSVITGAPPMASGLTAYLTSWGGINIVGLDEGGRVLASWWVPGFGGVWKISNLTTIADGPTLTGDSVTSFFAPWGALNIVGIDPAGDLQAYWWTPTTDEWQVANLTGSIPDGEPKPASQLQGQANLTHGGELNILGTDADTGELLRLFYRVNDDVWAVQNVSAEAEWV